MRKPFIAGNWKLHCTRPDAVELVSALAESTIREIAAVRDTSTILVGHRAELEREFHERLQEERGDHQKEDEASGEHQQVVGFGHSRQIR